MALTAQKLVWGPGSTFAVHASSITGLSLTSAGFKASANRFIVPKSGTLNRVGLYVRTLTGSPSAYRVGILQLNSSGNPNYVPYGGSSVESFSPTGTGWYWVSLGTPATAVQGDNVAAMVFIPTGTAGTWDTSNRMSVHGILSTVGETVNPTHDTLSGSTWSPDINGGIVGTMAEYSDSEQATPAITNIYESFQSDTTPDEIGAKFTVPFACTCSGCEVAVMSTTTACDYTIKLYDGAGTLLRSVTIDTSLSGGTTAGQKQRVYWTTPIDLAADTTYRLTVVGSSASVDVTIGVAACVNSYAKNWWPEGSRWDYTSRTDGGSFTDNTLKLPMMALVLTHINLTGAVSVRARWGPGSDVSVKPAGDSNTSTLNDTDNSVYNAFFVPKSGTINRLVIHRSSWVRPGGPAVYDPPPSYFVGLVQMSDGNLVTDTPAGGSAIETIEFNTSQTDDGNKWQTKVITLSTPAVVSAGDYIAARIWPSTGNPPSATNYDIVNCRWALTEKNLGFQSGRYVTSWTRAVGEVGIGCIYNDDSWATPGFGFLAYDKGGGSYDYFQSNFSTYRVSGSPESPDTFYRQEASFTVPYDMTVVEIEPALWPELNTPIGEITLYRGATTLWTKQFTSAIGSFVTAGGQVRLRIPIPSTVLSRGTTYTIILSTTSYSPSGAKINVSEIQVPSTATSIANAKSFWPDGSLWSALAPAGLPLFSFLVTSLDGSALPPTAPTNLVATAKSSTRIDLTWNDNSSDETSFQLQRSLSNSFTSPTTFSVTANATSYSDTTCKANTCYYYRIRAVAAGPTYSSWSNTANACTPNVGGVIPPVTPPIGPPGGGDPPPPGGGGSSPPGPAGGPAPPAWGGPAAYPINGPAAGWFGGGSYLGGRLQLGIWDRKPENALRNGSQAAMLADWSSRLLNLEFTTNLHGFATCRGSVAMGSQESMGWFDQFALSHVEVCAGPAIVWEGRLEDLTLGNQGIEFTALGYWRAFSDLSYSALWSQSKTERWNVVTIDDATPFAITGGVSGRDYWPESYSIDNNNRLFIAGRKDESSSSFRRGAIMLHAPDKSDVPIAQVDFDYVFKAPDSGFVASLAYLSPWDPSTSGTIQIPDFQIYGSGTAYWGHWTSHRGTLAAKAIMFQTYWNSITGSFTYQYETAIEHYLKIWNLRVWGSSGSAVTASVIAKGILDHVEAVNPTQVNPSTLSIDNTAMALLDEYYEDLMPADIMTRHANLGDYWGNRWEVGVADEQMLYLRKAWGPTGSALTDTSSLNALWGVGIRCWYVDVGNLSFQRSYDQLVNASYGIYSQADNKPRRTETKTEQRYVDRFGITRRIGVKATTTEESTATLIRDTYLSDRRTLIPRAKIQFNTVYDASGACWPLYMVRAGDIVVIRNLAPDIAVEIGQSAVFRIAQTNYVANGDQLTVEPEGPIPSLELLLARQALQPKGSDSGGEDG